MTNFLKNLFFKDTPEEKVTCPYCNVALDKMPGRKKKCPSCSNVIYVRTSPKTNKKILIKENEKEKIDQEWKINGWIKRLETEFGITETTYENHKKLLTKRFGFEAKDNDIIWSIFNELIAKNIRDIQTLGSIYWVMSQFLNDEKRDFLDTRQLAYKMELMNYKNSGVVKKVDIMPCNIACEACKKQANVVFTIEEALKQMPLPCKDCTNIIDNGVRGWCRCTYGPIVE
jgi:hypothetical protein